MELSPNPLQHRRADHEILDLFLKRWSPRAMSGEPLAEGTLLRLFEAARWAPSSNNEQEWRFLYSLHNDEHWPTFFGLLVEANQKWCKKAAALIVAVSKKTFTKNGKPNLTHSADTGMAIQNLLLQATAMGDVVVHPMAGFDRGAAKVQLQIPDDFHLECMIAVGKPGDPNDLPDPYREREVVSGRKPVKEFARAGLFGFEG